MKSAYELAMERMERESGPTKKLTDEQREAIADIDSRYDAKIAEQHVAMDSQIVTAPFDQQIELKRQLAATIAELEAKRDAEKERVWGDA